MKTITFTTTRGREFTITVPEEWEMEKCITYANWELADWGEKVAEIVD